MPANTNPIFTLTPVVGMVQISTANTLRDGTGTLGDVVTGGTNGTRVDRVTVTAVQTTTAGMVRLFIDNGAGTIRLFAEVSVTAITVSGTVQAFTQTLIFDHGLVLPSGYILKAGTNNAEAFNVIAFGGDY